MQAGGNFLGGSGNVTIGGAFTLSGGVATSTTGILTVNGNWTHVDGGVFAPSTGTVRFSLAPMTIDVASSETFYNLEFLSNATFTIAGGDTLVVSNMYTITDGTVNGGFIDVRGDMTIGTSGDGGTATTTFTTTGNQTIFGSGSRTAHVSINKSAGSVQLIGDAQFESLLIQAGTFLSSTGTLSLRGSYTNTSGGSFQHGSGTVQFIGGPYTIDVAGTETFYNLTLNSQGAQVFTIPIDDKLIVLNTFDHNDGQVGTGEIEVRGNMIVGQADGGNGKVSFLIAGDQTITANSAGITAVLTVDKPSGTVSATGNFSANGLTLTNGTFRSTSGSLTLRGAVTQTGGVFEHNSGTIVFSLGPFSIDVNNQIEFFNFTANAGGSQSYTISAGDTLVVLGTFTHTDGALQTGTIEVRGNVSIGASADGGSAQLLFTGTSTQTYTRSGNEVDGDITINKSGGSVILNSNAVWDATGQGLTIATGTLTKTTQTISTNDFTMNGGVFNGGSGSVTVLNTMTLNAGVFVAPSGVLTLNSATLTIEDDAEFQHNMGTFTFFAQGANINFVSYISEDVTFYNVRHNEGGSGGRTELNGNRLVVLGQWWHDFAGVRNGVIEARGDILVDSGSTGGTAQLQFTGTSNQDFNANGGNVVDGLITINKSSGSVILQSSVNLNAAGQDLTITSGTLVQSSSYSLSTGAVTVGTAGKWLATGTGTTTLGGNVTNNGLIDFRGNNTCGGPDALVLQSSVNGTQRSWSGSGKVVMYDVRIRDQGGTLPITAYSCTSVSNNAANWTFSTAQCPFLNPVLQIKGGEMRINSGQVRVQ